MTDTVIASPHSANWDQKQPTFLAFYKNLHNFNSDQLLTITITLLGHTRARAHTYTLQ